MPRTSPVKTSSSRANRSKPARQSETRPEALEGEAGLKVGVRAFGPDPDDVRLAGEAAARSPEVRRELGRARWRLLTTQLVEAPAEKKSNVPLRPPSRYLATIY